MLNLLIAMFSSTYERVKTTSLQQWRFLKLKTTMEHSVEVNDVGEIAPFGIVLLPFKCLYRLISLSCPNSFKSQFRLPWQEMGGRGSENYR